MYELFGEGGIFRVGGGIDWMMARELMMVLPYGNLFEVI